MAGRRKALIVAINDYENPELRRLRSPAADAEALRNVLADPLLGDFEVAVIGNEPSYEIQPRIEDLFADARADDVLLLHFSGHGLKSETGDLFLAAHNTRPNRLASTAISSDFVQQRIRTSPSRSIVLFLDCCYGGAYGRGVAVRAAGDVHVLENFRSDRLGGGRGQVGAGRGRAVITASNAMEYAFEGERLSEDSRPTPSLFTAALVDGISTGDADRDEDGLISLNELYEYVFDRVRERNPNQTPSCQIEMQGEFYLAKSGRRRPRSAPAPPDLQAAIRDANPYTRRGAVNELRSRLLGDDLSAAESARDTLLAMVAARTETQMVAGAAKSALDELFLHASPNSLDFGQVPLGVPTAPARVQLAGPPLARNVDVRVPEPWIEAQSDGTCYSILVSPPAAGEMRGSVTFSSAAGDAVIDVRAFGVAGADLRKSQPGHVIPSQVTPSDNAIENSREWPPGERSGPTARPELAPDDKADDKTRESAETGDSEAMFRHGCRLEQQGAGDEAETWYRRAAEVGHGGAMNCLGWHLERRGVLDDAEAWYTRAAAAGHSGAMLNLGWRLVARNALDESEVWFKRAANAGDQLAMVNLGLSLEQRGKVHEAEAWYRRGAEAGESLAMTNLAMLLERRKKPQEAEAWYRRAADSGDSLAMTNLAMLLERRRPQEAEDWYRRGVDAGDSKAMNKLGALLERRGEEGGAQVAYEQAADAGHPDEAPSALVSLGSLLVKQGRKDGARVAYEQAVSSSHPEWAVEARRRANFLATSN